MSAYSDLYRFAIANNAAIMRNAPRGGGPGLHGFMDPRSKYGRNFYLARHGGILIKKQSTLSAIAGLALGAASFIPGAGAFVNFSDLVRGR